MSKVRERIERQANLVLQYLEELGAESSYRGIERLVQLVLQSLLDLGLMVISATGGGQVETYRSVGVELYRLGVLNKEYSDFMVEATGMRNILVHGYARVNPRIVMKAAREELPDKVAEIVARIRSAVEKLNIDPELPSKGLSEVFKGRVKVAFLFGSRVKGYTFKGDYDFAVYFGREYTLRELGRLVVDLSAFLGVPMEKVDVVVLDNAPPSIVLEAVSGTPVYYEDAYTLFEVRYTLMRDALDIIWAEKFQSSILREKYLGER